MKYQSTRNSNYILQSMEVIKQGISPDGGLFVPQSVPKLSVNELAVLNDKPYQERALKILSHFLTDYTHEELKHCVYQAYRTDNFSSDKIAPLVQLEDKLYVQELWHGPTCAFKDMALQILPHFMTMAITNTQFNKEILILTATSGDTGKAALEGFKNVPGTHIIVFYPKEGVSSMQQLQMASQDGSNVKVIAVKGNFDDTQTGVKNIFGNTEIIDLLGSKGYQFSSANSINWGRLVPQIVYYFSAYIDLIDSKAIKAGEPINVIVPTGNFGNILAAYYAKTMGLPVNKLICASNENNVLTDFINTGVYDRNREFYRTISPSMDILISSNLERLLYELTDRNDTRVNAWMNDLKEKGRYYVGNDALSKLKSLFYGGFASDEETIKIIKDTHQASGYTLDPHTAVGKKVYDQYTMETGDKTVAVLASTASPFKFPGDVLYALTGKYSDKKEWELLDELSKVSNMEIPGQLIDITKKPILHNEVIDKEDMVNAVIHYVDR